ncbi:MAG: hypothetical protein V3S46_04330, partial [Nitrospinota bacterium]
MILKNALPLIFAYLIGQAPAALEHHNRVVYGGISTGARFEQVMVHHDGFKEKLSGNFVELETRSGTDTSINVKRPPAMDVYDRFSVKMPVKIYESQTPNRCDAPGQMVFIAFPPRDDGKTTYRLLSYNYLVCAGGGEVSPSRLFDKYMEKYGSYDEKDYDRNMHI